MLLQTQVWALMLLQGEGPAIGFDPRHMWDQMGWLARIVVIVLFLMSAWSIGVMIDRLIAYNGARKQSRLFAPAVAGALREGREQIRSAPRVRLAIAFAGLGTLGPNCQRPEGTWFPKSANTLSLRPSNLANHPNFASKPMIRRTRGSCARGAK